MNWTTEDERKFNEMQERRKTVLAKRYEHLMNALIGVTGLSADREYIADFLIEHADAVRDALEPYDSGIRLQKAEDA